jgi:hypothetical protein
MLPDNSRQERRRKRVRKGRVIAQLCQAIDKLSTRQTTPGWTKKIVFIFDLRDSETHLSSR